eukprot:scaffold1743_cov344-Prasinococcus_capsulatus_cf.AAC.2
MPALFAGSSLSLLVPAIINQRQVLAAKKRLGSVSAQGDDVQCVRLPDQPTPKPSKSDKKER